MHSLYCSDDYKYSLLSYIEDTVSSSETVFIMGDFNLLGPLLLGLHHFQMLFVSLFTSITWLTYCQLYSH